MGLPLRRECLRPQSLHWLPRTAEVFTSFLNPKLCDRTDAKTGIAPRTQRNEYTNTCADRWGRAGRSVSRLCHPPPFPPPSRRVLVQAPVGMGVAGCSSGVRQAVRQQAGGEEVCRVNEWGGGGRGLGGVTVATVEASAAVASEVPAAVGAGTTDGCQRCGWCMSRSV